MLIFFDISIILYFIGLIGIFFFKTYIINLLICFEILLLSINFNFIIFAFNLDDLLGQIFSLMVLTLAAGETSLGLALIIIFYRLYGGISYDLITLLKS